MTATVVMKLGFTPLQPHVTSECPCCGTLLYIGGYIRRCPHCRMGLIATMDGKWVTTLLPDDMGIEAQEVYGSVRKLYDGL
jgi:hypothetical protein